LVGDFSENDLCCKFKNNFHGNGGHFEISKPQKVIIHLCVKLSVFAVSMATTGILKFYPIPKYKNPPIWANFGFQVDYDAAN
jgi:hypothetical protein